MINTHKYYGLVIILLCCSGFTWGADKAKQCKEAEEMASSYQPITNKMTFKDLQQNIRNLCPDGAAIEFVKGLDFEAHGQFEQALQSFEKSLKIDEQFAENYGRIGLIQNSLGNKHAALVSLTKAVEQGANKPIYHLVLAKLFNETTAYPLTIYHYEKARSSGINIDKNDTALLENAYRNERKIVESESAYQDVISILKNSKSDTSKVKDNEIYRQKLHKASDLLREAVELSPNYIELRMMLADVLSAIGTADDDKYQLQNSAIKFGDKENNLLQEGDRLLLKRDFTAAIAAYKNAVKNTPTAVGYQKLGDAFLAIGNDDDALNSYNASLLISKNDAGVHYSVGLIFERKGDISKAIEKYSQSLQIDQSNRDARRRLADIYLLKGNTSKAISEYKELLKLAPDNPVIHFKLSRAYLRADRVKEAEKSLETAIKLDPENFEPRREYIKLEIKQKKYPEAEKLCRDALALNRDDVQERQRLVSILGKQRKFDLLSDFLREETVRYPEEYINYYRLGLVKEYLKDFNGAIASFNKAIEINPTPQSYHALARTYLRLSNSKKAKDALEEAKRLDPERKDTLELIELIDEQYGKKTSNVHRIKSKKKIIKTKYRNKKNK